MVSKTTSKEVKEMRSPLVQEFTELLSQDKISLKELRKLVFNGCPYEGSFRPVSWRILLNFLPLDRTVWPEHLDKHRKLYRQYIEEFLISPGSKSGEGDTGELGQAESQCDDHPLNLNPNSNWAGYFKDNQMLMQIDMDCRRLYPGFNFFQSATEYPCRRDVDGKDLDTSLRMRVEQSYLESETVSRGRLGTNNLVAVKKQSTNYQLLPAGQEAHWEVVERLLFIYCKLNPGQGYVQGMQEVAGPIYYAFANDPDVEWRENAESDAFFCFTNLMSEIRDNFIKSLDNAMACGIGAYMRRMMDIFKQVDYALWAHIDGQGVKPEFFAFRWLTVLLSQEFDLPDVIRLWDSLFADDQRFDFLLYVCCSMMILARDSLMESSFQNLVVALQNMDNHIQTEVPQIVAKANELYQRHGGKS